MTLDDEQLARLLARDRDALMRHASLPTAHQALWRVQLQTRRRQCRRAAAIVEWIVILVGALVAIGAGLVVVQTTHRADAISPTVYALTAATIAAIVAIAAIHVETRTARSQ